MLKVMKNSKGVALIYVLLIFTILSIAGIAIYSMMSSNQLNTTRLYYKKQASLLAVSGMQAYIQQHASLLDGHYGIRNEIVQPNGTKIDYYQVAVNDNGTPISLSDISKAKSYKVIITAIIDDKNHNKRKDNDETFFFKKELVYPPNEEIPNPEPAERTTMPIFDQLFINDVHIKGIAEYGAIIKIKLNGQILNSTIANIPLSNRDNQNGYASFQYGRFDITLLSPLKSGDIIIATADLSPLKTESLEATYTINPYSRGYVKIINDDGSFIYQNFDNFIKNSNTIEVLKGPIYEMNEKDENIYIESSNQVIIDQDVQISAGKKGNITIIGDKGITISPNATISQTHEGQGNISLQSTAGDIIMRQAVINVEANSSNKKEADISIVASNGNVDLSGSTMTAKKSISIYALTNIFVENLFVNTKTVAETSGYICGTLRTKSEPINGAFAFNCGK